MKIAIWKWNVILIIGVLDSQKDLIVNLEYVHMGSIAQRLKANVNQVQRLEKTAKNQIHPV
jgi:hypothetical protein